MKQVKNDKGRHFYTFQADKLIKAHYAIPTSADYAYASFLLTKDLTVSSQDVMKLIIYAKIYNTPLHPSIFKMFDNIVDYYIIKYESVVKHGT